MPAVIESGLALVAYYIRLQDLTVETDFPVKEQSTQPFEGFSERVTVGSDYDRQTAYGRWLKRLRGNQERNADRNKENDSDDKS